MRFKLSKVNDLGKLEAGHSDGTPERLCREFEPSAALIAGWFRHANTEDRKRIKVMAIAMLDAM
jgi:hypothetical protein